MTESVTVAGEGCRLTLSASGYQFPDKQTGSDANWLHGEVELAAGTKGTFSGRHTVWLYTDDLQRFRNQMAALAESLTGEARLDHIENQVGCHITLEDGSGTLTAFVREHRGAELRVEKIETDQNYVMAALKDLDALLAAYPVRGVPQG
jgi:hypothetical protein